MPLMVGDPIRPFTAIDIDGRLVDIMQFGGRPILLSFYRAASCPLCSLRVWYIAKRYPEWRQRGLQVVAIFESDAAETLKYSSQAHGLFPIIADIDKRLFKAYDYRISSWGIWYGFVRHAWGYLQAWRLKVGGRITSGEGGLMPMDFLIGPDLKVVVAHHGKDTGDHLSFDRIEGFLKDYESAQLALMPPTKPRRRLE